MNRNAKPVEKSISFLFILHLLSAKRRLISSLPNNAFAFVFPSRFFTSSLPSSCAPCCLGVEYVLFHGRDQHCYGSASPFVLSSLRCLSDRFLFAFSIFFFFFFLHLLLRYLPPTFFFFTSVSFVSECSRSLSDFKFLEDASE